MRNSTAKLRAYRAFRVGPAALLGAVGAFSAALPGMAQADVNTFTLRQPLNNATVRETVPIRVPRNLLSQAGYASISIDGQFLGGSAVPETGDVVYQWDTKHSGPATGGSAADAPESPDGRHVVVVSLFDKDSNEIATATSTVRVLNRITTLPDGVRLLYRWRPDEVLTYRLHSVLTDSASDSSGGSGGDADGGEPSQPTAATSGATKPAIQDVFARLQRSVEDIGFNGILLRDRFTGGTYGAAPLTQAFTLTSKYTTISKTGSVLSETQLPGVGKHYGYGVDEFPDRRVSAGDSWQTQMLITLPWAAEKMTSVRGQAKLDEFEWQSGYPTAKIVETYTGPATFHLDSGSVSSMGESAPMGVPGSPMDGGSAISGDSVQASDVTVHRTVWFAYEAGVVVREETTVTANPSGAAGLISSLTAPASATAGGQPGMVGGPQENPGGMPQGFTPPSGFNPRFRRPEPMQGYGNPQQQSPDVGSTSTGLELESDKTLTLLSVG